MWEKIDYMETKLKNVTKNDWFNEENQKEILKMK